MAYQYCRAVVLGVSCLTLQIQLILQFLTVEGDEVLQVSVLHLLMAVLADSEVNQQVDSDGCSVIVSLTFQRSLSMQMVMKRLSTSSNNERQTKNYGDLL